MLSGGDRRSLGRTAEVVRLVLDRPVLFDALFECVLNSDEVVRMRAADALEKVARASPGLLVSSVDRLLREVAEIDQPSVQWHVAQIVSEIPLTAAQRGRAIEILWPNLERSDDWIVVNMTLEALAGFADQDPPLRDALIPVLRANQGAARKSIAKRATKLLQRLETPPTHTPVGR